MAQCPDCSGVGVFPETGNGKCGDCHGTGERGPVDAFIASLAHVDNDCEICGGSGECPTCGGSGEVDD
jgi:DnaJ-class molecular chaperone